MLLAPLLFVPKSAFATRFDLSLTRYTGRMLNCVLISPPAYYRKEIYRLKHLLAFLVFVTEDLAVIYWVEDTEPDSASSN